MGDLPRVSRIKKGDKTSDFGLLLSRDIVIIFSDICMNCYGLLK